MRVRTKAKGAVNGATLKAAPLAPHVAPPKEFEIRLDVHRAARVTTRKLPGSPNYLYSVYVNEVREPILELISRPDRADVINALTTYRRRT